MQRGGVDLYGICINYVNNTYSVVEGCAKLLPNKMFMFYFKTHKSCLF
nr:hypothetical protein [Gloeochaete wittrockiana]